MRRTVAVGLVLGLVGWASAVQVDVTITVDNAYGFGFGDANGITTYFGGIRNVTAGEIFTGPPVLFTGPSVPPYINPGVGPELYQITLQSLTDYVYIVTWSDEAAYQGLLAGFQLPNGPLLSGAGTWRVFATGRDRDSNVEADTLTAADLPLINSLIAIANAEAGGAGTSIGWVDEFGMLPSNNPGLGALALGAFNTPPGFQNTWTVQGISPNSRWMWYNEDPANIADPFTYGPEGPDGHKEFLIFRAQIGEVLQEQIPEPGSLVFLAGGLAPLLLRRRRARRRA